MNIDFLSCNGLGYSPFQMISGFLHSYSKPADWLHFENRDTIFTYQARYAIGFLCQLLNIGPDDEVLIPAYNCGAEVDPFVSAGAKVNFYRIDDKALIDTDDIIRRVTPATRIIYITHFFGWPQEITEVAKFCKKNKIFLIEDCAQALFSKGHDNKIGQIGDAAIYSFVKSLPLPDGGALVLKNNILNESMRFKQVQPCSTFRNSMPLLKKWFMQKNKSWQRHELTRKLLTKSWLKNTKDHRSEHRPAMLKSNNFDEQKIYWSVSKISKGVLNIINPKKIIEKRRLNYKYLHNSLIDTPNFKPLFNSLPDNVCPLSFPFIVKDRNRWYKALSDRGILVLGWPGYYLGFDWDEFPEACNLKDNLMTLPIHQDLDTNQIEYIAGCVKQTAEKIYKQNLC